MRVINELLKLLQILQLCRLILDLAKNAISMSMRNNLGDSNSNSSTLTDSTSSASELSANERLQLLDFTPSCLPLRHSYDNQKQPQSDRCNSSLTSFTINENNSLENDFVLQCDGLNIKSKTGFQKHIKRFINTDSSTSLGTDTSSTSKSKFNTSSSCKHKNEILSLETQFKDLSLRHNDFLEDKKRQKDKINFGLQHWARQRVRIVSGTSRLSGENHKDYYSSSEHFCCNTSDADSSNEEDLTAENLEKIIKTLQELLKRKEDAIKKLQLENSAAKDIINSELSGNLKYKTEYELIESKFFKSEEERKLQMSTIHEILDACKILNVANKKLIRLSGNYSSIEDIASLESELYVTTENCVRLENALTEIKKKSEKILDKYEHTKLGRLGKSDTKKKKNTESKPLLHKKSFVKQVNYLKNSAKKDIDSLKKSYQEQPNSAIKEVKACRASRIKELVQEKMRLNENLLQVEKELSEKEKQLSKCKNEIDLLVQELSQMDKKINRQNTMLEFSRNHSMFAKTEIQSKKDEPQRFINILLPVFDDEDIDVIEIPEISYSDLIEFIQKRKEEHGKKAHKEFEIDDKISTSSKEFEHLSKELSDYKHKFEQLEKDYSKLRNEQPEYYDQAILKRKITFLEESNRAYLGEVESMKFANQDHKLNMQELKEKLHVMRQEVEMTKYQASLAEKKHETCRGKLERRIEKLKRRLESEENHSQNIKKEKSILQKKVDTGSFNDSGLEG